MNNIFSPVFDDLKVLNKENHLSSNFYCSNEVVEDTNYDCVTWNVGL